MSSQRIQIIDFRTEEEKENPEFKWFPSRKHPTDEGADVYSSQTIKICSGDVVTIGLRFGLKLPDYLAGFIFPRSSMAKKGLTCELPPIDSNYRGEIHAIISNNSPIPQIIREGDRIGQLVIMPAIYADFTLDDCGEADETDRGIGAFGSTGA